MPVTLYLQASGHPALKLCNPLVPCGSAYVPGLMDWVSIPDQSITDEEFEFPTSLDAWIDDVNAYQPPPEPPVIPPQGGGGAIIGERPRYYRKWDAREVLPAVDGLLKAAKRPQKRKERKQHLERVQDGIEGLFALIGAPSQADTVALRDLASLADQSAMVVSGELAFPEWRSAVLAVALQIQREMQFLAEMQDEEESVVMMLLTA